MSYLYLLSEDDNDDVFYRSCLSKITAQSYEVVPNRLRKGGGLSEVRKKLPLLLNQLKYTGEVANTFFLVAIDNDRSPIHANHERMGDLSKLSKADQKKACRYCEIGQVIETLLGTDRSAWPIPGAIAVPVEMIESWQLLICNPGEHEQNLPIFPERSKRLAQAYFTSSNVPEQLKDLVKKERQKVGSTREFCHYCAERLDVNDLMTRSPSFTQFAQQVAQW